MPQIIVHSSIIIDSVNKKILLKEVRDAISNILDIPSNIGQVILYESVLENRLNHPDRDQNFIFVEVTMYPGRTSELKNKFANNIIQLIEQHTGISSIDINLVIHEICKENYIGGISHKK